MSEARKQRRAQARAAAKAERRGPTVFMGDHMIASEIPGFTYEAKPRAELPPKIPGKHRWIVTAAWILSEESVEHAFDPEHIKHMDSENMLEIGIGCWDCEQPLGLIEYGSRCPARGD